MNFKTGKTKKERLCVDVRGRKKKEKKTDIYIKYTGNVVKQRLKGRIDICDEDNRNQNRRRAKYICVWLVVII